MVGVIWAASSPYQPARGSVERSKLPRRGPGRSVKVVVYWRQIMASSRTYILFSFKQVGVSSNIRVQYQR